MHLIQTSKSSENLVIFYCQKNRLKKFGKAYLGIDLGFYSNRSDKRHAGIAATIQQMLLS